MNLATETAKYVIPRRFESRNLEEALMAGDFISLFWYQILFLVCFFLYLCLFVLSFSVPDLETVNFVVLSRRDQYEIREVEV